MHDEIEFARSPKLTLGVEVELQVLDWKTHALCSGASRLLRHLAKSPRLDDARIKPEIFQSMIEINTGICDTTSHVRLDLARALGQLRSAGESLGLEFASAGTHAFSSYEDRVVFPAERFWRLLERTRFLAKRLVVFGLHVHLGMPDGDAAIAMMNAVLSKTPCLLALSASSPYWRGADTGLASSRTTVFEAMPTAGTPPAFATWADFERHIQVLRLSRSIESLKDLWWDVRPSPGYGTLEVRICDALPTLSETVALVALIQAYVARSLETYRSGHRFVPPPTWMLRENKWRAARWGLDAELVVSERGATSPLRTEIERMLVECEPHAQGLGCESDLRRVAPMLEHGPSYRRQREVFRVTRSHAAVMQTLAQELASDEPAVLDRSLAGHGGL
jgi:carboxylate-amine ligase